MSQRHSGRERQPNDLYETPEWVTLALVPYLQGVETILEPACGSGKMARALESAGYTVFASDLTLGADFLKTPKADGIDAIVTNPPFGIAREFIEHSLSLMSGGGIVAMLLRTDYDHAKTRHHLFGGCPAFDRKLVLTKRIVWFDRPGAAPSFNHAWFIWDCGREQAAPPAISYDLQAMETAE